MYYGTETVDFKFAGSNCSHFPSTIKENHEHG
jgi:hypothetical protein